MELNKKFPPEISQYLKKYSAKSMDFLLWLNGFEYLINFLYISEDNIVRFLLYMMEPKIIKDIEKKVAPDNPKKLSYDELISILEEMYSPYSGFDAAEYRFVNRFQMIGETVSEYVLALKILINNCRPDIRTDFNLLAQFINGIRSQAAKSILRKEINLTLAKAIAIAQQLEICEIKYF